MKPQLLSVLFVTALVFAQSCSKNNDDTVLTTSQAQTQAISSGSWRVTLFTDSGNDETSDFAGYSFVFGTDGTVAATKNGSSQTGSWSLASDSNKFLIDLGPKIDANKPLGELTDDWLIVSITSSQIRLADDNASSNEFLTFTKN